MLKPKSVRQKPFGLASASWLFLGFALSALVFSFVFKPDALPEIDMCLFHAATGLQCPSCGMTRAFCAISHGQFAEAWHLNPISFLLYTLAVLSLAYPFVVNVIPEKPVRAVVFGTIAVLLVFGVCRVVLSLLI